MIRSISLHQGNHGCVPTIWLVDRSRMVHKDFFSPKGLNYPYTTRNAEQTWVNFLGQCSGSITRLRATKRRTESCKSKNHRIKTHWKKTHRSKSKHQKSERDRGKQGEENGHKWCPRSTSSMKTRRWVVRNALRTTDAELELKEGRRRDRSRERW